LKLVRGVKSTHYTNVAWLRRRTSLTTLWSVRWVEARHS